MSELGRAPQKSSEHSYLWELGGPSGCSGLIRLAGRDGICVCITAGARTQVILVTCSSYPLGVGSADLLSAVPRYEELGHGEVVGPRRRGKHACRDGGGRAGVN